MLNAPEHTPSEHAEIVGIIQNILANKDTILHDPDLDEEPGHVHMFEELVGKFEQLDKRQFQSEEEQKAYETKRNAERNNLVSMLLETMRSKIELYEQELSIAERIQRKLIPEKPPDIPDYEIDAYYHPSKHIGGDYYDFHVTKDDRMYFVVADVSGHGIPSSLVVSSMQAYLYSQIEDQKSLNSMIKNLNRYLTTTMLAGKFVTLFVGCLELKSGIINYINAGHNPPYILRKSGESEQLTVGGPLLGMFDDVTFTSSYAHMRDGDILAAFTDGVIEAMNEEEEEFSEERLLGVVKENKDKPLRGIMLQVFKELRMFTNGQPYGDDVTLYFMRKNGKNGT